MPLFITTSRRPTRRVRSFCKELSKVFPRAAYVNRGKMNLEEVLLEASARKAGYALIVNVRKGNPGRIDLYDVSLKKLKTSFVCLGVKLAREMGVTPSPLRNAAVMVEGEGELEVLGRVLAEALDLPILKLEEQSYPNVYHSAVLLSPRRGYLGALNFLDLASRKPIGPLIRVKRLLPVEDLDA